MPEQSLLFIKPSAADEADKKSSSSSIKHRIKDAFSGIANIKPVPQNSKLEGVKVPLQNFSGNTGQADIPEVIVSTSLGEDIKNFSASKLKKTKQTENKSDLNQTLSMPNVRQAQVTAPKNVDDRRLMPNNEKSMPNLANKNAGAAPPMQPLSQNLLKKIETIQTSKSTANKKSSSEEIYEKIEAKMNSRLNQSIYIYNLTFFK